MQQKSQPSALRVGLVGTVAAPALALARLTSLIPPDPSALLRLLHDAHAPPPLPLGWTGHPVAGADAADVADIIVRNADLLLAGAGAADEWIDLALELGLPVLIDAGDDGWHLVTERTWRVSRRPPLLGDAAWSALGARLASLLTPPADRLPESLRAIDDALRLPARIVWRAHRAALQALSRTPKVALNGAPGADPPLAAWSALYTQSDALASGYADRYRSSYTIVLALAALALSAAVVGLTSEHHWRFAIPEALCLAGIIGLVWANTRLDWRSRLIQCRLLAELCRKQAALSFVGRSLPASRIAGLTREGELSWIGWRFAAAVRCGPLPDQALAGAALEAGRDAAAAVLLLGQHAYHEARATAGRRREATLVRAGELVFGATVLFVLVKLGLLLAGDGEHAEIAGLAAALLPAVAAAVFGFRAYAELELMVQQSERLVAIIEGAEATLDLIDPAQPGAGRQVGDVLEETAVEMLADVAGWIQVSRVKAVEAG